MNQKRLYHITTEQDWHQAGERGWYEIPSLAGEGFIHCSYINQVTDTANRYYPGVKGLVLLEIDPGKLDSRWVAEPSTGNDLYPHVYGTINLEAVLRVMPFPPDPDGLFALPRELE